MSITLKNKKKVYKKRVTLKGGLKNNNKNFLEEKHIRLKQYLKDEIKKNKEIIEKHLIIKDDKLIKPLIKEPIEDYKSLKLSIKKTSVGTSLLNKLSSLKNLNLSLFLTKLIICVFILPIIKYEFNIKNALNDMLRNLKESIFNIPFFKNNFNEIIVFLDTLGNLFKPYKYLKELLEKKNEENEKQMKYSLIKVLNYFMNYQSLIKLKLIIDLYKKKDYIFQGNLINKLQDSVSLISSIFTIIETILCPNTNHLICSYVSPMNNILLYSPYLLDAIETTTKIYSLLKKKKDYEGIDLLEKNGIITNVLLLFCSNNTFYKENIKAPVKTIKKKSIKKIFVKTKNKNKGITNYLIEKFKNIKDYAVKNPGKTAVALIGTAIVTKKIYRAAETHAAAAPAAPAAAPAAPEAPAAAAATAQAKAATAQAKTATAQAKAREQVAIFLHKYRLNSTDTTKDESFDQLVKDIEKLPDGETKEFLKKKIDEIEKKLDKS